MNLDLRVQVRVYPESGRRVTSADFTVAEMRRRMELARLYAILIAPVLTGNYLSRLLRADAVQAGVNAQGRAYARLDNDARRPQGPGGFCYGLAVEVGTKYMRAQHVLRRALRYAGD